MRVLVADDKATTRFKLKKMLNDWGYEVVEATNGNEAWEILTGGGSPSLALLDWVMPGMTGVEVCKKLDEKNKGQLQYLILLTSKSEKKDLVYALDNGAHDFVSKPVFPEELRSRIDVGRRLVEMSRLKNKFLGMAAHDLRNPLYLIRGLAELMLEEEIDSVSSQEFLKKIVNAGDGMLALINDLLDISAIESGRLELQIEQNLLKPVIEQCIALIAPLASKKNIRIDHELEEVVYAEFDPVRIAQVIENLLSNAVKFSPLDTTISIFLTEENQHVKVSVKDEGPGISDEERDKLFGEFQKLSAQPTGDESSTGLGLAIVKKIVEAHQGYLEVESEYGKGAVFSIFIPFQQKVGSDNS
jgi:signal transduction histidine kinase